jgi:hypothetical protein
MLLSLLAMNYLTSRFSSGDFRSVGGETTFPTLAMTLGRTNIAFVLNRSGPILWVARETKGQCMPLVRTGNNSDVLTAMFSPRWTQGSEMQHGGIRLIAGCVYADAADDAGNAVSWQLWFGWWWNLAALFAVLPACQLLAIAWRRLGKLRRARRAAKLRIWRRSLTLCRCGYDLRETESRCPECGRMVRWVPVSVDRLHRRGQIRHA